MLRETVRLNKLKNGQKGRLQLVEALCRETVFSRFSPRQTSWQLPGPASGASLKYKAVEVVLPSGRRVLSALPGSVLGSFSSALLIRKRMMPKLIAIEEHFVTPAIRAA